MYSVFGCLVVRFCFSFSWGFIPMLLSLCSFVGFHLIHTIRERQPILLQLRGRGSVCFGGGLAFFTFSTAARFYLVRGGESLCFFPCGLGSIHIALVVIRLYGVFLLYFA